MDVSDDEVVAPNPNLEPEEDQDEERLLGVLSREHSKPVVEVVPYDGKLDTNVVLDWIFVWRSSLSMKTLLIIGRLNL